MLQMQRDDRFGVHKRLVCPYVLTKAQKGMSRDGPNSEEAPDRR
jgi:hypothetical protein